MVKVRSLESVPFSRYLCLCNVLHICNIRAILTYRVYRLYDFYLCQPVIPLLITVRASQHQGGIEPPKVRPWQHYRQYERE